MRRAREKNLEDFVRENDKAGLISFLETLPKDGYDNNLMVMMVDELCDEERDEDDEVVDYSWHERDTKSLIYAIMMARIEDKEIRDGLHDQIASKHLDGLLQKINALKAGSGMSHEKAFFDVMKERYSSVPSEEVSGASAVGAECRVVVARKK